MKTIRPPQLDAAERFVWLTGRLLERLRFAHLFRGADRDRLLAALRVYQNPDGGFGEALEPDFRGPVSQPTTTYMGLRLLDGVDAFGDPMVRQACDYLASITTEDGGVPSALPNVADYPHPFWWSPPKGKPRGALPTTAAIAGYLHKHGVEHPWLAGATEFCWQAIEAFAERPAGFGHQYSMRGALVFLDNAPDRARAEGAAAELGRLALDRGSVALDPLAPGEVHYPLDFAPVPGTLASRWFDGALIERHLDALVAAQQEDGGWTINWTDWAPLPTLESRAWQTVERLATLRAYGRFAI